MSDNPSIQVHDVIGIGFGPSNLAIAGAFLENQLGVRIVRSPVLKVIAVLTICQSPISVDRLLFIERHDEFKWHPAMLLPGAQMQIRQVMSPILRCATII